MTQSANKVINSKLNNFLTKTPNFQNIKELIDKLTSSGYSQDSVQLIYIYLFNRLCMLSSTKIPNFKNFILDTIIQLNNILDKKCESDKEKYLLYYLILHMLEVDKKPLPPFKKQNDFYKRIQSILNLKYNQTHRDLYEKFIQKISQSDTSFLSDSSVMVPMTQFSRHPPEMFPSTSFLSDSSVMVPMTQFSRHPNLLRFEIDRNTGLLIVMDQIIPTSSLNGIIILLNLNTQEPFILEVDIVTNTKFLIAKNHISYIGQPPGISPYGIDPNTRFHIAIDQTTKLLIAIDPITGQLPAHILRQQFILDPIKSLSLGNIEPTMLQVGIDSKYRFLIPIDPNTKQLPRFVNIFSNSSHLIGNIFIISGQLPIILISGQSIGIIKMISFSGESIALQVGIDLQTGILTMIDSIPGLAHGINVLGIDPNIRFHIAIDQTTKFLIALDPNTGSQEMTPMIPYTRSQGMTPMIPYTGSQGMTPMIPYTGSQGMTPMHLTESKIDETPLIQYTQFDIDRAIRQQRKQRQIEQKKRLIFLNIILILIMNGDNDDEIKKKINKLRNKSIDQLLNINTPEYKRMLMNLIKERSQSYQLSIDQIKSKEIIDIWLEFNSQKDIHNPFSIDTIKIYLPSIVRYEGLINSLIKYL